MSYSHSAYASHDAFDHAQHHETPWEHENALRDEPDYSFACSDPLEILLAMEAATEH